MKLFGFTVFLSCIFYLKALKYDDFKSELLPLKESCGFQNFVDDRQSGGTNEYPWMVHIPLEPRIRPPPNTILRCTGALISKRYFIMSKYCLQHHMKTIYLGQYDVSKNVTCGAAGCKQVQAVDVEIWIGDELEIAIVRLNRDIEFTEYIQPICLPFEDFPKAQTGETVYSSGWGVMFPGGDYSKIKKKINQTLISNKECEASGVIKEATNDRFMCTKIQHGGVTDIPCHGDDGTPIMYRTGEKQWVLQGILPSLSRCVIDEEPVGGARMNEEALQFILKHMRL